MNQGYALFDLDHTLLPYDTQALFCNFVLRKEGRRRVYLLWYLPLLPLVGLKILSLRFMKRLFFSYLCGMEKARLDRYVAEFLETDFDAALYPEVVAELERNRSEGRTLILNSASPEFYLGPIAKKLGFDFYLGTNMDIGEKVAFLPPISGPNNKQGAKIDAMRERDLIPPDVDMLADSWAYSDSSADIPLLSVAEHGVMIHPGEKLANVGLEKGWRTLTPSRPYEGKWGARWASLLQAFGLYQIPTE